MQVFHISPAAKHLTAAITRTSLVVLPTDELSFSRTLYHSMIITSPRKRVTRSSYGMNTWPQAQ